MDLYYVYNINPFKSYMRLEGRTMPPPAPHSLQHLYYIIPVWEMNFSFACLLANSIG